MKSELFKALDSFNPTYELLREYAETRINFFNSPLVVVFKSHNGHIVKTKTLTSDLGELVGVEIEDTLFYARTYSVEQAQRKIDIKLADVKNYAVENLGKDVKPMTKAEFQLLIKNYDDYKKVVKYLELCGYKMPLQQWYMPLEKGKFEWYAYYNELGVEIDSFAIQVFVRFNRIIFTA